MRDLDYEDIVAGLGSESHNVTGYLGLRWDPACLKFYEMDNFVSAMTWAQSSRLPATRRWV